MPFLITAQIRSSQKKKRLYGSQGVCVYLVLNGVFPAQVDVTSLLPVHVDPLLLGQLRAQITHKYHEVSADIPPLDSEPRLLSVLHYAVYCGDIPQTVVKALILSELAEQFEMEGE